MAKSTFNSVLRVYADVNRQKAIAERQRSRLAAQATVAADRQRRAEERMQAAEEKEDRRLYLENRAAEVAEDNAVLEASVHDLGGILDYTLGRDDFLDFDSLKGGFEPPPFEAGALGVPEPEPTVDIPPFMPPVPPDVPPLTKGQSIVPGKKAKHERLVAETARQYEQTLETERRGYNKAVQDAETSLNAEVQEWRGREAERLRRLQEAEAGHQELVRTLSEDAEVENARIEQFRLDFDAGTVEAVRSYFAMVLQASAYPDEFPRGFDVAYLPGSFRLVVEREMPLPTIVPEVKSYKYVKTRDERTSQARSASDTKRIYSLVLAQIVLRTVHEVLEADRSHKIQAVTVNGFVTGPDPATGRTQRIYLVSLDADRAPFLDLALDSVDPSTCLKSLGGRVSAKPSESEPVAVTTSTETMDEDAIEASLGA